MIQRFFQRLTSAPPHQLIKRILQKFWAKLKIYRRRILDRRQPSFTIETGQPLNRLLHRFPPHVLEDDWNWLGEVAQHYLAHRFDLLGSGWVRVFHGMNSRGVEGCHFEPEPAITADKAGRWLRGRINPANLAEAQRIWNLIDAEYCPIDWHLDFKSGFRWREDTWYKEIQFGHLLGVDVKVPWELARMQHLPQLAWAYALAKQGNQSFCPPEHYLAEFRNQVLDFIATNPPRWGVNWSCAMDVAIRAVNWLTAYDLLKNCGAQFDPQFERVFSRSICEHGKHIVDNLESSLRFRGNHYLSDIVGLLFISTALPCDRQTNRWLIFGVQELIKEVQLQFHEDGSNFEASTSYHRLSAELVVYATALALGLSEKKKKALRSCKYCLLDAESKQAFIQFPNWYFLRLERMAEFTMHITKSDGHIPQFGDNDNGRLLKLLPVYQKMFVSQAKACYLNLTEYTELSDDEIYWMEDGLDHRHLVAAINGLFARADFEAFAGSSSARESQIIAALSQNIKITSCQRAGKKNAACQIQIGSPSALNQNKKDFIETRFTACGDDLRHGLELIAYPNFGFYLFRSTRLYLAVRCGSVGQNGNGGHAHNDQLAIELVIDGKPLITDPGTYHYTALPVQRNLYRSARVHFVPHIQNKEPGDLTLGEFMIGGDPCAAVIYFGLHGFLGRHEGYRNPVYRQILIEDDGVVVKDFAPGEKISQTICEKVALSPAYGVIQNQTRNTNEEIN